LRKSPTRTPAFLAANRLNAQESTGPRTVRGKAQSCLNRLKTGERSRVYRRLWLGLIDAPPCAVERTAGALLTREQAAHPVFAELVGLSRWAENMVAQDERRLREYVAARQKEWAASENAPQAPVGTEEAGDKFLKGEKHLVRQPVGGRVWRPTDKGAKAQRKQSSLSWRTLEPWRLRFPESDGLIEVGSPIGPREKSSVFHTLEVRSGFGRGRTQNKKMLKNDVGSRKVIENKRNKDILSSDLSDILGNSERFLTEIAHLGVKKVTFAMRFGPQCTVLATPRCEPENLPDARRRNDHRPALDVDARYQTSACGARGPESATWVGVKIPAFI
jgi:hypothetical protein